MPSSSIILSQAYRHGRTLILPGVAVAFEDPDAVPFFLSLGIAETSDAAPAHVFSQAEVDIDPRTVFGGAEDPRVGQRVIETSLKGVN